MKVKNIMFSGVMAAILGATAAQAADDTATVQLISKKYADRALQHKLTTAEGSNVTLGEVTEDGTQAISVDLSAYATNTAVTDAISNAVTSDTGVVKTAIDGVQDDVDALDEKVGDLPNGTTATNIVEYIDAKTADIASDEALGQLTTRVDTAEGEIDALQISLAEGGATANAIAAALTAGQNAQSDVDAVEKSLADNGTIAKANAAAVKSEVDAALDLKADASALNNYRTSANQDLIDNEIKASITDITEDNGVIDTKVGALETALDGRLDTLEQTANALGTTYAAKSIEATVQTNTNDIATLKAIDHSKYAVATEVEATYATKEALETVKATADAAATKDTVNAIDGRLTTAEGEIDALQQAADTYATKAEITDAKYMSGVGQAAGQYVVNFDADGNATYTAITIVE